MATSNVFGSREPIVKTLAAATTLQANQSGTVFILDASAGKTITLPALAKGLYFKFIVGAAFATDNWIIDSAEGDNINGAISDMGTTVANVPAVGEDQINFVASAESIGDFVELIADYDNSQWIVSGRCAINGGITVTDPS